MIHYRRILTAVMLAVLLTPQAANATVAASTSRVQHTCNGSTVAFPFTWNAGSESEAVVIQTVTSTGVDTDLIEGTDYTISCANDDCTSGGTVTTTATCPTGSTITILRDVDIIQENDLVDGMPALYETLEEELDHQIRVDQQLSEKLGRTISLRPSSTLTGIEIPEGASRAIGWNSSGTELTTYATSTVTNAEMDTIGNYADLATACSALSSTDTLWIDEATVIADGETVACDCSLVFIDGGSVDGTAGGGTETLTIAGGLVVIGVDQSFGDNLTVTFGVDNLYQYSPYWHGGTGQYNLATGSGSLSSNTTGQGNNAYGHSALSSNTSGIRNTALGYLALRDNTSGNNNFAGGYATLAANTTGVENVAIGTSNMIANTTGYQNVAIGGSSVLSANTSGTRNIGVNSNALNANTTGSNNIAIGYNSQRYDATGSYNVSIGTDTLSASTRSASIQNVAIGGSALSGITTGDGNTAIGMGAFGYATTASRNIAVGFAAGQFLSDAVTHITDGTGNIFIGENAYGSGTDGDDNQVVIGKSAVGIGPNSFVMGTRAYTDFMKTNGVIFEEQPTPTAKTTATVLTISDLSTKIITGTHAAGANINYQLPAGADIDSGIGVTVANNDSFDWILINLSAAAIDTITITANTGHTIIGRAVVQSSHSTTGGLYGNAATFRTRKTAANTYVTYRIN